MADKTGVLSPDFQTSSRFCTTNILVLSLLFTEHHFLLPSHAGNAFLLRFMFYQLLFGVVTHNKMRVPSFPFLARSSEGPATWLVKLRLFLPKITSAIMTRFTKPSALACVREVWVSVKCRNGRWMRTVDGGRQTAGSGK